MSEGAKRSFRWRGFGLTVEVPGSVARRVRRNRSTSRGADPRSAEGIEFMHPTPQPRVAVRDPVHALDLIRVPPGHSPPTWTPQIKQIPAGMEDLAAEVSKIVWYHSIELPGGLVTPGQWDHRTLAPHYGFPRDMGGMTALDVATFDGFWAFEMERRGADVTAVDLDSIMQADFPPAAREQATIEGVDIRLGAGFELARRELGSTVKKIKSNVYALDPAKIGTFDLVHVGDLMVHLERPLSALRAVRSVTGKQAYITDVFLDDLSTDGRRLIEYLGGWEALIWSRPSLDALGQLVIDAGFRAVRVHTVYRLAQTWESAGPWRAVLIADI